MLRLFLFCRFAAKQEESGQTEQQLNGTEESKSRSKAQLNRSAEDDAAHAESCKEDEDVQSHRLSGSLASQLRHNSGQQRLRHVIAQR